VLFGSALPEQDYYLWDYTALFFRDLPIFYLADRTAAAHALVTARLSPAVVSLGFKLPPQSLRGQSLVEASVKLPLDALHAMRVQLLSYEDECRRARSPSLPFDTIGIGFAEVVVLAAPLPELTPVPQLPSVPPQPCCFPALLQAACARSPPPRERCFLLPRGFPQRRYLTDATPAPSSASLYGSILHALYEDLTGRSSAANYSSDNISLLRSSLSFWPVPLFIRRVVYAERLVFEHILPRDISAVVPFHALIGHILRASFPGRFGTVLLYSSKVYLSLRNA
jgi:hypothetical protein